MHQVKPGGRALIIGWRGGVGAALLRLLASHPAGSRIADRLEAVVLAGMVDDTSLAEALVQHRIDQVIEVADVDTLATSAVCARHGAAYLSASMQRDGQGHDALTMVAALDLLPGRRPDVGGLSHLIGAGMNPGVVNALAFAGIDALAARAGVAPEAIIDDLYALHVTEEDTTALVDGERIEAAEGFAMSWSPLHALEEILEPHAMYVTRGELARLDHRPHDRVYGLRCGDREIAAMIVPHEELVTLGHRFGHVECAFAYAIPEAAFEALRRDPDRPPDRWQTHRLYPPHALHLIGCDRVGVLVCTRRHGELWIGYETEIADGARYGSNATLLQAAAGVLAGWSLLGSQSGIHVVEELDWRAYLATVDEILGPRRIHHVPDARPRLLAERRLP